MAEKIYYVYFVLQKQFGSNRWCLKVGHSLDPRQRVYSYNDQEHKAYLLDVKEFSTKELALHIERAYVRILKQASSGHTFGDCREWFLFDNNLKNLLNKWEISYENYL